MTSIQIKFSLIIGTLNRGEALAYCLQSLKEFEYESFEVIVIDQSQDDKTENLIKNLNWEKIVYKHVGFRGLSKARNEAMRLANGDYICLVDDDAYYPKDYLNTLCGHINETYEKYIYTGRMWDSIKKDYFVRYDKLKNARPLSWREMIRYCPSPCITFPAELVETIGYFDEEFGVGAKYGAGEETDYLLRAAFANYRTVYYENILIEHPHKKLVVNTNVGNEQEKAVNYARGIGAMYRKHFRHYEVYLPALELLLKDIVKTVIGKPLAKYIFNGHLEGFMQYHK